MAAPPWSAACECSGAARLHFRKEFATASARELQKAWTLRRTHGTGAQDSHTFTISALIRPANAQTLECNNKPDRRQATEHTGRPLLLASPFQSSPATAQTAHW